MDIHLLKKALHGFSEEQQNKVVAYIETLGKVVKTAEKPEGWQPDLRLQAVLDCLPENALGVDREFRISAINGLAQKKILKELGLTFKLGDNCIEVMRPYREDLAVLWQEMMESALKGETVIEEYYSKKGGKDSDYNSQLVVAPHRLETGEIIGCITAIRDTTELSEQRQAAKERELIYKTIVDHARAGIDILDITHFDGKNPATATLFIRNKNMETYLQSKDKLMATSEEVAPLFTADQQNNETSETVFERMVFDLSTRKESQEIFRIKASGGKYFDIDALQWVIEINGRLLLIRFFRDFTEALHKEKLINKQLEKLNEQNEVLQRYIESNMQLENFAYIASHDLQAPIRSIVSFSNLLQKRAQNLSDSERDFLSFIISSAKNMQALIGDLLSFSRANTEKIKLKTFKFSTLSEELVEELRELIKEKKGRLSWDIRCDVIAADYIKLKQILMNLIGNSLKFQNKDNQPEVLVSLKEQEHHWEFLVKDNGIGIAKEFQEKIFLIFKRLHTQEQFAGTGIGLALCKRLVEQHEGEIWLESELGKGTSFSFTIKKGFA
ncbi:ATP-binding protein [Lewinella sp. LCG006]|uniref:sensor histidine kinase n=1 Tax=Lewinella sp. LCG006 TaxID=3231911 RepID=UPI00345F528A